MARGASRKCDCSGRLTQYFYSIFTAIVGLVPAFAPFTANAQSYLTASGSPTFVKLSRL